MASGLPVGKSVTYNLWSSNLLIRNMTAVSMATLPFYLLKFIFYFIARANRIIWSYRLVGRYLFETRLARTERTFLFIFFSCAERKFLPNEYLLIVLCSIRNFGPILYFLLYYAISACCRRFPVMHLLFFLCLSLLLLDGLDGICLIDISLISDFSTIVQVQYLSLSLESSIFYFVYWTRIT